MKRPVLSLFLLCASVSGSLRADDLKVGTSLCRFGDCSLKDLPVGSLRKLGVPAVSPSLSKDVQNSSNQQKKTKRETRPKGLAITKTEDPVGNLPSFYSHDRAEIRSSDGNVYNFPNVTGEALKGLKSGDMIHAVIEQSIKASPSVPTPVRATIMNGQYRGNFLLGSATLDRELKRILIQFNKLRRVDTDQIYQLKASGLSLSGQIGLEGRYESNNGRFFVGELLAATAAGFLDATTQRSQNSLGNYVQEPSISNAGKQGAVQALSKSADRFAEEARTHPESTEIDGFQEIQVIIEESPVEVQG